ncbi:MAG: hypothetical protein ABL931_03565 [Usitatibacteraceae bacterium]
MKSRIPGVLPSFTQERKSVSLTVSAARLELASFETRLGNLGIRLEISDETLAEIAKSGLDPKYGARPLNKTIEMQIEYPISKAVLKGRFVARDTIKAQFKEGVLVFEK